MVCARRGMKLTFDLATNRCPSYNKDKHTLLKNSTRFSRLHHNYKSWGRKSEVNKDRKKCDLHWDVSVAEVVEDAPAPRTAAAAKLPITST